MSRDIISLVGILAKVIEKLLIRVIVVGMVILVSVQIVLTNPNLEESLISRIPRAEDILVFGQSEDFKEDATPVFYITDDRISLTISSYSREGSSEVKLLLNGQGFGDFSAGKLDLEVKEGDRLLIDARGVEEGQWFEMVSSSKLVEGKQLWIHNELKDLGEIEFVNKF